MWVCGAFYFFFENKNCRISFHPFIGIDNVFGRKLIYMFHMPLFFIISGLLSKSSSFSKLFYSLIIPYIFYNLISFLRLDFYSVATIDALKLDNSPTWFFAVLCIVKLIADKIKKYYPQLICIILLMIVILHVYNIDLPRLYCINATIYGFLFFLFGKFLKNHINTINLPKIRMPIYFVTFFWGIYVLLAFARFDMYLANTYNPIVYFTTSVLTSLSILLLCRNHFSKVPIKLHDAIMTISRGTMLIVGTHYVILRELRLLFFNNLYIPFLVKILVVLLAIVLYYFLIKITYTKIPILYGKKKHL